VLVLQITKTNYMKKQIQNAVFCLLLLASFGLSAQQMVSGVVTDDSGSPLPAVNVVVKGTTIGVSTNFDGNYSINATNGQVLVFSSLGFELKEVAVESATLNVTLLKSASELDEVILIGYGTSLKKDLTGAVNLVTDESFNKGTVFSAQQLIQGKVAGVSIVNNGGAPGEGANVLIRGIGSLNLNSNPLYVVNGIPLDAGGVGGSRNPLNVINPNDIESISILKDASATAIYGSRAANGVVLISTKRGVSGDFTFNFNSRMTTYTPTDKVDVLTANEFRQIINATGNADYISKLGTESTDWQDIIYKKAFARDYNFSMSGSVFNTPLRASIGSTSQGGILKDDSFERITASVNISPSFLDQSLRMGVNVRFMGTENDFANRDAIGSALRFDPTKPVYDMGSPFAGYYTWLDTDGSKLALSETNPLALLNLSEDTSSVERLIANVKVDWDAPVKDLVATVNFGYDGSEGVGNSFTDPRMPVDSEGFNGSNNDYTNKSTNILLDAYLNYKREIQDFNFNVTAGYSYQSFEYDNSSSNYTEYLNPDGSVNTTSSITNSFVDSSKNVLLSYFGRANINYKDVLLLTATLRADASSKLPDSDRWGQFESFALAWNLHETIGADNIRVFDKFKLRLGYGEVGNVNGLGDYNFLTRYQSSTNSARYSFGNSFYTTYRPAPINKDLRWEIGTTINAGLDFSFKGIDLAGSVNFYKKETNDLIATAVIDPFTNFGTTIDANIGDMENKGVEFEIGGTLINNENFSLAFNYNISYNDNEILRLENEQNVGGIGFGSSIQRHREGMTPFAYFVYKQIYDSNGKPIEGAFADLNSDGVINGEDRYFYKDPYADILMGFTLNATYKNFDVNMTSRASIGNYSYNSAHASAKSSLMTNLGRLSNISAEYLNSAFVGTSGISDRSDYYIQNASFFKIDNISVGYTISDFIDNNPLRLYVAADNVLVVTDYDGIDPEITGGIDSNFYPRSSVLAIGVNFNF
jgi:TonB-linked SusC/RagA family outer membrane protein